MLKRSLLALAALGAVAAVAVFLLTHPDRHDRKVTIVWSGKPVFVRRQDPKQIEANARRTGAETPTR
jgi:hypothetical protein